MEYTYIHNHQSQFIEMTSKCQSSVKLSSIATYSIGLTYAPEDVNSDGIIVLRSGNIQDGSITLEDIVRVNKPIKDSLYVKKGNILMCSRNGSASLVGKTAIVGDYPERMTFGAFMTLIKTDIPEYINAFFSTPSFRYQVSMGKSSTMNQITQKMLDSIELPLVSVSEQEQFAEIVRQSDKSKFDGFKSQFIEMFGDMKYLTSDKTMSDFFDMKAGQSITAENIIATYDLELFPCYGGNGLRGYVTHYTHEGHYCLIGRQGALCGNVNLTDGKFFATEHAIVVTPKISINTYWLFFALSEMNLNRFARGVAQPGLSVKQLETIPFSIPPTEEQEQFERLYRQADKSKYYEINET